MFFRIYLYFGIILALFAVLIGFIFMNLYEQSTVDSYRQSIEEKADRISNKIAEFSMNKTKSGFSAYNEAIKSMENKQTTDIWIVSNKNAADPLEAELTNVDVSGTDLGTEIAEVLQKAFAGKKAYNTSFDDIYEMAVLRVAVPVYDARGNVSGAVMIVSMIESQKDIINSSKSLIFTSALAALIISFVIAILFARQISKPVITMRAAALQLAEGNYETETCVRRKDEIGDLANTLDILADRLKDNETERENMEQMRRDFFANVSHELRTPITVMRGYTELLSDGVVTDEPKKQQYYHRMNTECQSMERLVGDLLTLSKMQNPDFEIDAEPVNLVQVFDDIMRSAHMIANEKNIKLHMEKDADVCMMYGDYDRLRQMFMIIFDNAVKFSSDNGNIYIKITSQDKLRVAIKDEGIGISEDDLPYIFEKFYKSKLRQNAKGSGLGLMIAKQIAIRHGGDIEVQSKVGKGTTFKFSFDKIDPEML